MKVYCFSAFPYDEYPGEERERYPVLRLPVQQLLSRR